MLTTVYTQAASFKFPDTVHWPMAMQIERGGGGGRVGEEGKGEVTDDRNLSVQR